MTDTKGELAEILKQMENLHYPAGPIYANSHKSRALLCMADNELEAIYNLVESHTPNLRFTAACRYEKASEPLTEILPLNKNNFNFNCSNITIDNKIENMLEQIMEMPEEWTIVQLTSMFNIKESLEVDPKKMYTSPLHVTVFNCGKNQIPPFTINIDPPKDKISGNTIEIRQEMHSIINENKEGFEYLKKGVAKVTQAEKQMYFNSRFSLNRRIEDLVKQIQCKWLAGWRCLLMGKFVDSNIEKTILSKIEDVFENEECLDNKEKNKSLLKYLVKGGDHLKLAELRNVLLYMFPKTQHKNLRISLVKMIQNLSRKFKCKEQIRHPIILIIDEKLDCLPWEMMDILQDHPVSRMPSLHFTYALFKEHENTIVNGWKISSKNGSYIINPGLDLKNMERRLCSFFNYWLPNWSGLVGVKPTETDFQNMLSSSEIFVYSGHGDGTQFLASERIQRMRVNAVVLLFGCGSVQLTSVGPQVEMYSSYQMYLIACSPCIVGMLWSVTDVATDAITTEFLSQWLESEAPKHWKLIDKQKWSTEGTLDVTNDKTSLSECDKHEPDLLRALCKARKASKSYLVQAACVARGLPVRIH